LPAPNTYTVKALRATFTLTASNAVFPGTSANVLQVTGLRMSVHIQAAGAAMSTQVSMRIYGMSQQDMNALAVVNVLNGTSEFINNTVLVEASPDGGQSWSAVFAGAIVQAGPDYTDQPDVYLSVQAQTGFYEAIATALPTSFPGSTDVATAVSVIAAKMGVPFQNNGVNAVLPGGGYFAGSLLNQLQRICDAAHVAYVQDGPQNTVTIAPWGSPRTIEAPFVLTPSSGLDGYPRVRGDGFIEVRSIYNPAFLLLGPITIAGSDTIVGQNAPTTYNSRANGNWIIGTMTHALETQKPGGMWFTDMVLYPANSQVATAAP
jgi:hypothetical protein